MEDFIANERRSHEVFLEIKSESSNFFGRHGESRSELSEQSLYTMAWNFPNAEESKDMVDAISCEIFCHLRETTLPPLVAILFHHLPIVGGEAPVLTIGREGIRWCTCLSVHVEIVWLNPGFYRVARDTDGDVTFEHNTFASCIVTCSKELHVKEVLDIIVVSNYFPCLILFGTELLYRNFIVGGMFGPLTEVWSTKLVAQIREGGIRTEPMGILV